MLPEALPPKKMFCNCCTPEFHPQLPGRVLLEPGSRQDYFSLQHHHYRLRPPATWQQVVRALYLEPAAVAIHLPPPARCRLIGAAVLSWPVPISRARTAYFSLQSLGYGDHLRFANTHLRCVSRVVVHPQFRAIGLAQQLVAELVRRCPTRFVESTAHLARFCPFLDRAGFTRIDPDPNRPAYFVFDRSPGDALPTPPLTLTE